MDIAGFWRALVRPQVRRTCTACGYSWTMPRYYTKHHLQSGATPASGPLGSNLDWKAIAPPTDQWLETKAQFAECAKCHSHHYTQKRIWTETRAQFEQDDEP